MTSSSSSKIALRDRFSGLSEFVLSAQEGSFTAAGAKLGLTSSAAGKAVSRLEERLVICASRQYLDKYGEPKTKDDLMSHNCVVGLQKGQRPLWLLRNEAGAFEPTPVHARHEWGDGEAMLNAALAGCGVAQLPTW